MPVESNHPHHQSKSHQQNGYSGPPVIVSAPVAAMYRQDDLDLAQILKIIQRRGWLMASVAIAVTSTIWGWTLTRTPIYRGEFRVLVEEVSETDPSQQLLQDNQIQLSPTFDYSTQIEVLRSPALLEPIAERLRQDYPDINAGLLAGGLVISRLRDTKVLSVSYLGTDPDKIQAVLEEVSNSYLDYSYQERRTSLQQGVEFVDSQLPDLRERVNTLQVRLEKFRQEYSLIDPESRGNDLSSLISGVEKQRQETQTQLSEARSLYNTLQNQLGFSPDQALAASALSESPRYQSLLNQIREVESQIAVETARWQPGHYAIATLEDKRAELLPLLDAEAERILGERATSNVNSNLTPTSLELSKQLVSTANQVKVLEARSGALTEVEARLKNEFELVPALAREYTDLQRELKIATESLNRFLSTRETLQIDAAQKSTPWELLSGPATPQTPISPNVPRNLAMGAIAGLLLAAVAAAIAEKLDSVFHSPDEIKAVTKLPLLGVIPFAKSLQVSSASTEETSLSSASESELRSQGSHLTQTITTSEPSSYKTSPFFESFRSFYANIRFLSSDTPIRSLVISSAAPGEGKSTTSVHLAKAAAAMGQRVLLIDADLRCPQIHSRLNLPNLRGLSNAIVNELSLQQVIQRSPGDENLCVITAGPVPPDPIKLLSSRRMQNLMAQVRTQFDLVIYDMPPLLGFADSNLLAAHTDGMVLVVGLGKTDRAALGQALEALKISPIPVLGLVANGIRAYTTHPYSYYRYHRYYTQQTRSSDLNGSLPVVQASQSRNPDNNGNGFGDLGSWLTSKVGMLVVGGVTVAVLLMTMVWLTYIRLNSPNQPPRSAAPTQPTATQPTLDAP
ncbi:MAG: polysaccharide biosynthesis tyrosine autokinase [Oculatellaceae cyanobacterium bins.114]|nr:polysaccharide biosynthesis tyrosine autokinase [Oculatellaceae cyanobacterium bins.114]